MGMRGRWYSTVAQRGSRDIHWGRLQGQCSTPAGHIGADKRCARNRGTPSGVPSHKGKGGGFFLGGGAALRGPFMRLPELPVCSFSHGE